MARWSGLRGLLVVCAVVAGLFAMHGLAQHGDHLPTVASAPHAGHAAHDSTVVTAVAAPLAGVTLAADPTGTSDPSEGYGALTLCLTVIAAACLAVWTSVRPRGGVLRTLTSAVTAATRSPAGARAPDPPDLWVLSVCRC